MLHLDSTVSAVVVADQAETVAANGHRRRCAGAEWVCRRRSARDILTVGDFERSKQGRTVRIRNQSQTVRTDDDRRRIAARVDGCTGRDGADRIVAVRHPEHAGGALMIGDDPQTVRPDCYRTRSSRVACSVNRVLCGTGAERVVTVSNSKILPIAVVVADQPQAIRPYRD